MAGDDDNVRPINPIKRGIKWELEGQYNPDRRYTRASDKQGHCVPKTVMFPTEIAGEMSELVQSGYIPEYRSAQDLIRDAVIHHMHKLNEDIKSKRTERVINLTVIYDDAMRKKLDREHYEDYISILNENLHWLIKGNQKQEAKKYLIGLLGQIDAIPQPMQQEFREYIKEQLRDLA